MPDREVKPISDPKRLRAMAHPLRWKLLNLIGSEHSATATRCAEVLGESVASCSYHLNMLAKYDFIEEAPGGQGREKPWRLTENNQSVSGEGLNEEGQLAAEAAGEVFLDYEMEAMKASRRRKSLEPEPWRQATGAISSSVYLTAAEAAELRGHLLELAQRHEDRWDNPDLRPADARQVRMFLSVYLPPYEPKK